MEVSKGRNGRKIRDYKLYRHTKCNTLVTIIAQRKGRYFMRPYLSLYPYFGTLNLSYFGYFAIYPFCERWATFKPSFYFG